MDAAPRDLIYAKIKRYRPHQAQNVDYFHNTFFQEKIGSSLRTSCLNLINFSKKMICSVRAFRGLGPKLSRDMYLCPVSSAKVFFRKIQAVKYSK